MTTRYSELFRRVFAEYDQDVVIEIDGRQYSPEDIPRLLPDWCTNAEICRTLNFRLSRADEVLFSLHDHPRELFVAVSERPFIERLRADRIVRYRLFEQHERISFIQRLRRLFAT